jgi:hypothetical protein
LYTFSTAGAAVARWRMMDHFTMTCTQTQRLQLCRRLAVVESALMWKYTFRACNSDDFRGIISPDSP